MIAASPQLLRLLGVLEREPEPEPSGNTAD
jgi:hypothetical protein